MNPHSISALPGSSAAAQFASQVQQLQTQSPQEFHAILTQLTGQLDKASGGPASIPQPSAPSGNHHHGGGHHLSGASQSNPYNPFQAADPSDPQNQTLAASLFGSITPAQNGLQSLWG